MQEARNNMLLHDSMTILHLRRLLPSLGVPSTPHGRGLAVEYVAHVKLDNSELPNWSHILNTK